MNQIDIGAILHTVSLWALPVLLAITLHEAGHGYVAWKLGDDTAYRRGRVTLNPLKHIDLFGTIILPAVLFLSSRAAGGGFIFGYAKPVPVDVRRLGHFRRDSMLVAAAGPGANILLAVISGLLVHMARVLPGDIGDWAEGTLGVSIYINVLLAVFNMFPLLPLDGGRVIAGLMPPKMAARFYRTERYGMLILLGLIFLAPMLGEQMGMNLNILGWILGPASDYLLHLVLTLTGLTD